MLKYSPTVHQKAKSRNALLVTLKGVKYGALAGFIASSLISLAIAGAELAFGLPIGTFYSVIGIISGLNNVINGSYLGFGLHLVVGILCG
ncbi:MAG TPA: hypothetical protein VEL11_01330, partial [Candidatus Bathyarchaeia archaeon]|nr:hypothetical protein [Candidatus Bathyarchaeia archaeon]